MALFSRRPPTPSTPSTPPDETFTYWDQETADEFRALVRTVFAEIGSEVQVFADHVVNADGTRFGLGNLAAVCHNDDRGRRAWREIVTDHVRRISAAMTATSEFETMSDADILAGTFCRVMPTAEVLAKMSYAIEVAPGVSRVFNLDLPQTVRYFQDEQVDHFGEDTLLAAGMANLRTVQIDDHERLEHNGGTVDVLMAESLFTASLILVLDEIVPRYGHTIDPELGVFVGMPFRHQLCFHVPRDETAAPSLHLLAGFAATGNRDSAGPVSPSVFWWRPQSLERISIPDDDGIRIEVGPELGDLLNRVSGG